jgi:hypothetical protein
VLFGELAVGGYPRTPYLPNVPKSNQQLINNVQLAIDVKEQP